MQMMTRISSALFLSCILIHGIALIEHSARGAPTCDVRSEGAVGNGTTKDTAKIQAAIDRCSAYGGGTVLLRDGVFLSGMIVLRSNITLEIETTAALKGTQNDAD